MKFNHYYFVAFLVLLFGSSTYSQTTEWFVLNDSGSLVHAKAADTDDDGNLYLVGDYKGEVLFKSAKDTGTTHHNYISESLQTNFLAKYDAAGSLEFVINIPVYSSGINISSFTVKVLSTGEIAWIIYVDGESSIVDARNRKHMLRANRQSVMILLSPTGEMLSQTTLPLEYCREIFELPDQRLLFFGKGTGSWGRKNILQLLDRKTMGVKQLFQDVSELQSLSISENKIFMLAMDVQHERMRPTKVDIRLYSADLANIEKSPDLLFTKHQSGNGLGLSPLFTKDDEGSLIFYAHLRAGEPFTFDEMVITPEEDEMMLFKINQKGKIINKLIMKTKINGSYNTSLKQSADGGYYVSTPVMGAIEIDKQDTIIPVAEHGDFVNEQTLIKLDKNFNFKWKYPLGGTASNYHQSLIIPHEGGVYYATDLLDYITVDENYHELDWRAGLALGRIRDDF